MKVRNKVAVVTGAGSGMGRELTLALVARGASVAAIDIRQDGLDETARLADAGDAVATFVVDVTDREAVAALPAKVIEALGQVDLVVNNAGIIQPFVRVNDLDRDVIDKVIDVNLHGPISMVKAFLPHLLERPEAHLANVSSMGGFLPVPGQTMYGATKAAVKLLSEGLHSELLDTNVGVSVIMPGAVETNITENSGVASPVDEDAAADSPITPLPASEAAQIMLDGIEADRLHIFVGKDSRMMGLANRLAPQRSARMIAKQMKDLLE